ncbi:caspase family protein [Mucilaginibacter celer]|uniref:Caspase family protein n=1 Tax=Mucilaginibacter celer TaxID=2305508 RepID=A0A494VXB4_9SPHI|nr:caspase family protein [Mucilaginibacter celer]AYL98110.1 caspase family protein [Mucilaginibacter celer]
MNKRILIIGNTDGLPGVKIDIANYQKFFKSEYGGGWLEFEFVIKTDPSLIELSLTLSRLKQLNLDYLIVIFSGHGGQDRETVLELNSSGEAITESALKYLAPRQLNIFDCCRSFPSPQVETRLNERFTKAFSAATGTREKFEKRIMQAIPQQASLYSCSIGEVSHDTATGGVYSRHLIDAATSSINEFQLVGTAHNTAAVLTKNEFRDQNPEAVLVKSLSSQQLIIGIDPNYSKLI